MNEPLVGFDEATETRWQRAIYELCKTAVGPKNYHLIDGGGCDSGDALDFTLSEISQTITLLSAPELLEALEEVVAISEPQA